MGALDDPIMLAQDLPLSRDDNFLWVDPQADRMVRERGGNAVAGTFKCYQQVGETRLPYSMGSSNAGGRAISASFYASQISAIVPGKVPCGVSCQRRTEFSSNQMFKLARSAKAGIVCQSWFLPS